MCFLIEPVYCMTWIWTLHRAHKLKSPIKEDNIWANKMEEYINSLRKDVIGLSYRSKRNNITMHNYPEGSERDKSCLK